ncbi:CapA family protein [Brevibacillus borstelensis]|uniref:CapA family protein n=1 Tax=Brevibacillus borstelensis TaxID=45462 RepID=UPI0030BF6077
MSETISFVATGDYLQTRRIPSYEDEHFQKIAALLQRADARITNLEIHVSYNEGTPAAISGGTHIQTTPDRLDDLKAYGFNLVGTANNHMMDFQQDGLLVMQKYLREYGILHAGSGENLFEAGKPAYLDTPNGRVALIAVASSAHLTHMASEQRRDMKGRPGVNGLRHIKRHVISGEELAALRRIAEKTEVNGMFEMMVEESFISPLPDNLLPFGYDMYGFPMLFQAGEEEGASSVPHEQDMRRLENTIDDAARQADYVIVSFHAHEMKGAQKQISAEFVESAARRFIDAGAHAVVGHGPHALRGIEIYRRRPIFYSLCDFVFQDETVEALPQDFYDANKIPDGYAVMQAMDWKTQNGTKGLVKSPDAMESVIAAWSMAEGDLKEIVLYPIELGYEMRRHQSGFPRITANEAILKRVQELSSPYGTELTIENGVGVIRL